MLKSYEEMRKVDVKPYLEKKRWYGLFKLGNVH